MSPSKNERELALFLDALDDEPVTDEEARETVRTLGIETALWAADVRKRVIAADEAAKKKRFEEAARAYRVEQEQLAARKVEAAESVSAQRAKVKRLLARAPQGTAASVHALKFEQATSEELAQIVTSLRHLLGDDEDL